MAAVPAPNVRGPRLAGMTPAWQACALLWRESAFGANEDGLGAGGGPHRAPAQDAVSTSSMRWPKGPKQISHQSTSLT